MNRHRITKRYWVKSGRKIFRSPDKIFFTMSDDGIGMFYNAKRKIKTPLTIVRPVIDRKKYQFEDAPGIRYLKSDSLEPILPDFWTYDVSVMNNDKKDEATGQKDC